MQTCRRAWNHTKTPNGHAQWKRRSKELSERDLLSMAVLEFTAEGNPGALTTAELAKTFEK